MTDAVTLTRVAGDLLALWEVSDEAKTHVAFAPAHATQGTHRREAKDSLDRLRSAFRAWFTLHCEGGADVLLSPEAAARATPSPEQRAALHHTAQLAGVYVKACDHYARTGSGLASKHRALLALCKALDVLTFYRNGPVVSDELDGVALPPGASP